MIIGGDASRLTNNACGTTNSWLMCGPIDFVVNLQDYTGAVESRELDELNILSDNFLLELPLIWRNGIVTGIMPNLFSAVFFLPTGEIEDVRSVIFLERIYTMELFGMETRELIIRVANSIDKRLEAARSIQNNADVDNYAEHLEAAQTLIAGYQFAACVDWDQLNVM